MKFYKEPLNNELNLNRLPNLKAIHSNIHESSNILSAEVFVEDLVKRALNHRAVKHPYLESLAKGVLPDLNSALKDFALNYHGYSSHFPKYLSALITKLSNPLHRTALVENLNEESGRYSQEELNQLAAVGIRKEWFDGVPHPELFRRFCVAIGTTDICKENVNIEVECWREMLLSIICNGSEAEAIGALGLGTETIVQPVYKYIQEAIAKQGYLSKEDSVFFTLHTTVDDHHQAVMKEIAVDLARTEEGRNDLAKGMHKALAIRDSFWNWMYEKNK